jgi:hypothetical protein
MIQELRKKKTVFFVRKEIFIFLCFNGPFYFIFGNFIDQLFGKMAGISQMNEVMEILINSVSP